MATDLKIDGKLTTTSGDALADYARRLYDKLGTSVMVVGELRSIERTTPAPGEDKSPGVKLRIAMLEPANPEQEHILRDVQRALWLQRTANGTLNEDGEIEISKETLRLAAAQMHAAETARLRAQLAVITREAHKAVAAAHNLRDGEIRAELQKITDRLDAALHPGRLELEDA